MGQVKVFLNAAKIPQADKTGSSSAPKPDWHIFIRKTFALARSISMI
jgi:hypothetical protein